MFGAKQGRGLLCDPPSYERANKDGNKEGTLLDGWAFLQWSHPASIEGDDWILGLFAIGPKVECLQYIVAAVV